MIEQDLLGLGILKIDVKDMARMSQEEPEKFNLARKNGLGGSDSSIILDVNPFKNQQDLLINKLTIQITEEDKEIQALPNVRKGSELEPIILRKFEEFTKNEFEIIKPKNQYRFIETQCLTINYDGLFEFDGNIIPVEAKLVSKYAEKYWDKSKAVSNIFQGTKHEGSGNVKNFVTSQAKAYGIPVYYYTQVQQELMGTDAPYGFLAALFDNDWTLRVFKIYADPFTQMTIRTYGEAFWKGVEQGRTTPIEY